MHARVLVGRIAIQARAFSASHAPKNGNGSHRASAVTVHLQPERSTHAQLKRAAIERVKKGLKPQHGGPDHNAAVILVSRTFAPWLNDHEFMPKMLAAAGMHSHPEHPEQRDLTVLAAAVDEVPRYSRELDYFASSEGISVLRGNAGLLLPHLWDAGRAPVDTQQASLEFQPPDTRCVGPMRVTVPLANTIFTSGTPHTLLASRWRTNPGHATDLVELAERTRETVVLRASDLGFLPKSATSVRTNLVPVTQPRKVLASLGNILSKVEINGQPAPPSKELEAVVPQLLEQRHKRGGPPPGPVGVWALTIPKRLMATYPTEALRLEDMQASDEPRLARATAQIFDMLIADGCRLSKVLSGGGGWGPKQGLLSLDPQTTLASDEHQDMQSFIDSFKREAVPKREGEEETFVQFFVEAMPPTPTTITTTTTTAAADQQQQQQQQQQTKTASHAHWKRPAIMIGTAGSAIGLAPPTHAVEACVGLFGAVSSAGVYLERDAEGAGRPAMASKLDAPGSYLISTAGSWTDGDA